MSADRPPFASGYPNDPALDELVRAFEEGNYARVREGASKLAAATEDAAVRASALDLRSRIEADPIAKVLLVLTGVLLVALTIYWVAHAHTAPQSASRGAAVEHPR